MCVGGKQGFLDVGWVAVVVGWGREGVVFLEIVFVLKY